MTDWREMDKAPARHFIPQCGSCFGSIEVRGEVGEVRCTCGAAYSEAAAADDQARRIVLSQEVTTLLMPHSALPGIFRVTRSWIDDGCHDENGDCLGYKLVMEAAHAR